MKLTPKIDHPNSSKAFYPEDDDDDEEFFQTEEQDWMSPKIHEYPKLRKITSNKESHSLSVHSVVFHGYNNLHSPSPDEHGSRLIEFLLRIQMNDVTY